MTRPARDRRGVAAVELALIAPLLALIMLGITDLVQFMRAQVRVETTAVQVGQTVSQCDAISSPGDTGQFWALAQGTLGSVATVRGAQTTSGGGATGAVVVTAVRNLNGANRVAWQVRTGAATHASAIGSSGGAAALPGTYVVPPGQLLIVTEVFAPTQPRVLSRALMAIDALPQVLSATSMYLSRLPDATAVTQGPSNNSATVCMS
jgi:Flp pilus assembly protein TadG